VEVQEVAVHSMVVLEVLVLQDKDLLEAQVQQQQQYQQAVAAELVL
jgi:hypothetical protein